MAEIVGIVAGLVAPALELGKCFKKQFKYLCCLKTNIKDLTDAEKDLDDMRVGVQMQVDVAKRNGEVILPRVETWLTKTDETQGSAHEIIGTRITTGFFGLKSRYSLGKKAKKTSESMKKLRDSGKFDLVSQPTLPASMGPAPPPSATVLEVQSRKQTEDDIIMTMNEGEVYIIGVCGMGGVGKTTMAKRIMNRARGEGHFDEVVLVPVGQQADLLKIQHGIADWLRLNLEEETLAPRAIRLRARLVGGKRTLIIIDDVWERINLEDLGIPFEAGSCTILLTSRDKGVFYQMNAQRIFTVETLSDEEAWFMFKENAGACVDDSNLLPIASEVAKECKGLPLALVTVARALKGTVSKSIWLDARKQLRSYNPVDMPNVIAEVYNPIKLSYDFLESPHSKSLVFLCSVFPEDHDISLECLAFYGLGLCIFEGINNLEDARNRIIVLVEMLKNRFLLLDGKNEKYVKMHDVVRDVAIFIASKENQPILEFSSMDWPRQKSHSDCNMLSVVLKETQFDFPMGLTFPSLRFLWMEKSRCGQDPISDHFFIGMQQLKVLYINSFSFGSTLQLLKNLHTLHLVSCTLETLSAVGELVSLEILSFRSCLSITEFPVEIGRLNCLRLLEVIKCYNLKTIMPGVISRLGRLEEFKMLDSFEGWKSEEKENERSNVSLAEFESLSNLTCLEIEIEDGTLAAQELQLLSSKIVKYDIRVGERLVRSLSSTTNEKKMSLNFPMDTLSVGNWIHVFARSAESLHLEGDASNNFDFASHQNMRCLVFKNCQTVVKLVNSASTDYRIGVFPVLESLELESLPKLEEICDGSIPEGSNSFAKLKKLELSELPGLMHLWRSKTQDISLSSLCTLHISECGKLRRVFSSSMVIRSLSQLKSLYISHCDSMEEVFWIELEEKDGQSACITIPKLERLMLTSLRSLTKFCKGIDSIELPRLVDLGIDECPKLVRFIIASDQNHLISLTRHDSVHVFCDKKLTFGSLKRLYIRGYDSYVWCRNIPHPFFGRLEELDIVDCVNINNLFSYSIVANFVSLRTLNIYRCNEMVYVIADDSVNISGKRPVVIFHKLEEVELIGLPKLQIFWEGRWDIDLQFPSLKQVEIRECPRMEGITMGSISTPNLKEFKVNSRKKSVEDLIKYPWL